MTRTGRLLVAGVALSLWVVSGCSSDDDSSASSDPVETPATEPVGAATATTVVIDGTESVPTTDRPAPTTAEPAATTSAPAETVSDVDVRPVPDGGGVATPSAIQARAFDGGEIPAMASGYAEHEYLVSGVAATYAGPATGPATVASTDNPFVTRVLVRLPTDPAQFSGRVFVEPFNTSGGSDADVVWSSIGPMLEESGDAWVGVTVRASSVAPLQAADPVRYADLQLPTNDLAWDIIRQLGGTLRQGGEASPLGDVAVEHVYLAGYSQSGIDVATFASALNAQTRMPDGSAVFAGYLPAAHAGSLSPLQSGTSPLPTFESAPIPAVDVPVVDVETQADVEGFRADISPGFEYVSTSGASVRRDDSDTPDDRFRLFEIAGAPHAGKIPTCDGQGSAFPTQYVMRGAIEQLTRWAEDGVAPPTAPRIELTTLDVVSVPAVDDVGNALGGVRTPFVDVPLVRYEVHSTPGALCMISGNQTPLPPDELVARYGGVDGYLVQFTAALDAAIAAGTLRQGDRQALVDLAAQQAQALFPAG